MKWLLAAVTVLLATPAFSQELTVAVSANAQIVFEKLRVEFEKEQGIKIEGVIGSSGKLTAQIEHGAPFDIFLSADSDYPSRLYQESLATTAPRIYARGQLALWSGSGVAISQDLSFLKDDRIRKIAVADPKTAPYGRATVALLQRLRLYNDLLKKIVFCESISQVNQYVTTGSVDVGFTSFSSVTVVDPKLIAIAIAGDQVTPIPQAAVTLKRGATAHPASAEKFFRFLFSEKAQSIFVASGYSRP